MAEYDWSELNGTVVERLRKPKIAPVPDPIIRQAQRSVDGDPANLKDTRSLHHVFKSEGERNEFVKQMRKAGAHTRPLSTMTVIVDPDREGIPLKVGWKAGKRRGKAPA